MVSIPLSKVLYMLSVRSVRAFPFHKTLLSTYKISYIFQITSDGQSIICYRIHIKSFSQWLKCTFNVVTEITRSIVGVAISSWFQGLISCQLFILEVACSTMQFRAMCKWLALVVFVTYFLTFDKICSCLVANLLSHILNLIIKLDPRALRICA